MFSVFQYINQILQAKVPRFMKICIDIHSMLVWVITRFPNIMLRMARISCNFACFILHLPPSTKLFLFKQNKTNQNLRKRTRNIILQESKDPKEIKSIKFVHIQCFNLSNFKQDINGGRNMHNPNTRPPTDI